MDGAHARYRQDMGNLGELISDAWWPAVASAAGMLWVALLAHPWLIILLGFIVVASVWMQLRPRRNRRRAR
jgi:nitrate/nitrite transporter NarK